jgi:hypothetical protein
MTSTERELLVHFCSSGLAGLPADALERLRRYQWTTPDHQIIFEALLRLVHVPAPLLRTQLPVEATRMGFPDMLWDLFFDRGGNESELETGETAAKLLADLIAGPARGQ